MKKTILLLTIMSSMVLIGCTEYYETPIPGPQGPPGVQGPQGIPGESGYVFEYSQVFFEAPDFEVFLPYPEDFQGLASDVALVYFLWDIEQVNGEDVEVWRPLPQQVFAPFGIIQYNYDFTTQDVRLFMEGTFEASQLGAIDTDDWIVRVVVVPGDFWGNGRMTYPAYEELEEKLKLQPGTHLHHETKERR